MKTKHYFFLSCAVLGLAWGWVYNVSGQNYRPSTLTDSAHEGAPATPSKFVKQSPVLKAPADIEIYAAMTHNDEWEYDEPYPGIYSVATSQNNSHDPIEVTEGRAADGGAVYVDGIFYTISGVYEEYEDDSELLDVVLTAYDTETWDVIFEKGGLSYSDMASDLAYDPTTGNIYGIFKNSYYRDWGILDVETGKHTVIKEKMTGSAAVAFDMTGQAYGITNSGELVTIDKETGETSAPLANYNIYQGFQSTGVIDAESGDFYWLADSYSGGGVYKIDLNSYELTQLYEFKNHERFAGAYIPGASVEPGTPSAAQNLSASFPAGSLTGSISFVAPTESWDDDDLSGTTFTYVVKANEEKVAEGSVKAGEIVTTAEFTLGSGYNKISVTLSNEEGEGLPAALTAWIGPDGPAAAGDVKAVTNGQTVTITWSAPTEGMHKGYVNPADVTYTLMRFPDEVIVAENVAGNVFTDIIETTRLTKYYYSITPYHNNIEGNAATSEKVLVGEAAGLPWDCIFNDEDCELMTVEDTNGDGNTWSLSDMGAIYLLGDEDGDDWLFSMPFKLEAGRNYHLVTSMETARWTSGESFEIKYGNAAKSEAMTETLVDVTDFGPDPTSYPVDLYFSVKESGTYFIGFHALSDEDHYNLTIKQILLEQGPNDKAPGAPEVSAKAGEKGALSTTLTIVAPTVTFDGSVLTQLTKADIYHHNQYIGSVDSVEPGKECTYTDNRSVQGENTYKVVFVNNEGGGLASEVTVFVGNDIPLDPTNVKVTIVDELPVLTWDELGEVGVNGGYVDPGKLKYEITYVDAGEWIDLDEDVTGNSVEISYEISGEQRWFVCSVTVSNELGSSAKVYSNGLIIGDSYSMPFKESVDGGANSYFWSSSNPFGSTSGSWSSDSGMSASEKGGCLVFRPYGFFMEPPYTDTLTSGLINVADYGSVSMSFFYYNDAEENDGDMIIAELYDQDNDITYSLGSATMDVEETEWREFIGSCTFEADTRVVIMRITVVSNNGSYIYLDEFSLSGTSGVDSIVNNDVRVYAAENAICIAGLNGENVTVASINGVTEHSGSATGNLEVAVSEGIYVVRVANRTYKVIVK